MLPQVEVNVERRGRRNARSPERPPRGASGRCCPRRSAFTLLEVMLATVIIGLGVLGLTALFAGAAKQQLDTARTATAGALSASIESRLGGRLGIANTGYLANGEPNVPPLISASTQYDANGQGGIDVPFRPGLWYPISAYNAGTGNPQSPPPHALALDPGVTDLTDSLEVFFLHNGPRDVVLYENRLDVSATPAKPTLHGVALNGTQPPTPAIRYVLGGAGTNAQPFNGVGGSLITPLTVARIQPGSVRARFEIARQASDSAGQPLPRVASRRSVVFEDSALFDDADDIDIPDDDRNLSTPTGGGLTVPPGMTVGTPDRLRFHRALQPGTTTLTRVARIEEFDLNLGPFEWVERIVLESHSYRMDRLLTLEERVSRNPDGATFSGAATLLQESGSGGPRAAVLTYIAEPLAGKSGQRAAFIPPESGPLNKRLLRLLSTADDGIRLRYDDSLGRAYISTTSASAFAFDVGDILLIAGDPNDLVASPGADGFVRVVQNAVFDGASGAERRSYLDATPTAGGRPQTIPYGQTSAPANGVPIRTWALQRVVESLNGSGNWRITPVSGRVFPGR